MQPPPSKKQKKDATSRAFTFTQFNEPEWASRMLEKADQDRDFDIRFIVYQGEKCPDTGRHHLQGYMEFHMPKTLKCVINYRIMGLIGAHFEIALGSKDANIAYCTKDESYWPEAGLRRSAGVPVYRGVRTVSHLIHGSALAGQTVDTILLDPDMGCSAMRMVNGLQRLVSAVQSKRVRSAVREVNLYIGTPGSGKTHSAVEWLGPGFWTLTASSIPDLRGYDCEQAVLFDDFEPDRLGVGLLKNLLDDLFRGHVQAIGGTRPWVAERIAITTNVFPREWSSKREYGRAQQLAIYRRFTNVFLYSGSYASGNVVVSRLESYGDRAANGLDLQELPEWWRESLYNQIFNIVN